MEDGGQLHVGEQVGAVVGADTVGAQGDVHSRPAQDGHTGHAGAQLQVGIGVMDGGNPFPGHDLHVLIAHPDAVSRLAPPLPHAVLVKEGNGGFAILLQALLMLRPGL